MACALHHVFVESFDAFFDEIIEVSGEIMEVSGEISRRCEGSKLWESYLIWLPFLSKRGFLALGDVFYEQILSFGS